MSIVVVYSFVIQLMASVNWLPLNQNNNMQVKNV